MLKRTLNGTFKKALKISGFFSRMLTNSGRKILKNRRNKKRYSLCICKK